MPLQWAFPSSCCLRTRLAPRGRDICSRRHPIYAAKFAGKLTFVPVGHEYHEWQTPRTLPRVFYFYLDATALLAQCGLDTEAVDFVPRVLFEDAML
jgi:hypothetical protein